MSVPHSFFDPITGFTINLRLLGAQAAACMCPSQHARKDPGLLHWPAVPPHCHKNKAVPWPTRRSAAHQCQSCPAHRLVASRLCPHPRWFSCLRQGSLPLRRRLSWSSRPRQGSLPLRRRPSWSIRLRQGAAASPPPQSAQPSPPPPARAQSPPPAQAATPPPVLAASPPPGPLQGLSPSTWPGRLIPLSRLYTLAA